MSIFPISEKDFNFIHKVYGKWFNLDLAGIQFICYTIITLLYPAVFHNVFKDPDILYKLPGITLMIMGIAFFSTGVWYKVKENDNYLLLMIRGVFDFGSGLLLQIFPLVFYNIACIILGVFLIVLGFKFLLTTKTNIYQKIADIYMIISGLISINVFNLFIPMYFRVGAVALFLGILGAFLIYLSIEYRKNQLKLA